MDNLPMNDLLYDLELMETVRIDTLGQTPKRYWVTRVPGGWLFDSEDYILQGASVSYSKTSVFVPFNNEYQ